MRISCRFLASHGIPNAQSSSIFRKPPSLALLPPIPLYRRLLRAHRHKLPPEARLLGDEYVKSEFRLHRDIENPLYIVGFLKEWQLYAQKLEGDAWRDGQLDAEKFDKMSDQQIGQLYELMQAIKKPQDGGGQDEREREGGGGNTPLTPPTSTS